MRRPLDAGVIAISERDRVFASHVGAPGLLLWAVG
jgi:hypothetical protein